MIRLRKARAALLAAAVALALGFGAAHAIEKGTVLYIRAKNTRVMDGSGATAKAKAVLQPGAEVKYVRRDEADKRWHWVQAGKVQGAVYMANLDTKPPRQEDLSEMTEKEAADLKKQAGNGAAVRALAPNAERYATESLNDEDVLRNLAGAELLARDTTDEAVLAHARAVGLAPSESVADRGTP